MIMLFLSFLIVYDGQVTGNNIVEWWQKKNNMALCQMCRGNNYLKNFKYFGVCHIVSTYIFFFLKSLIYWHCCMVFELLFPTLHCIYIISIAWYFMKFVSLSYQFNIEKKKTKTQSVESKFVFLCSFFSNLN